MYRQKDPDGTTRLPGSGMGVRIGRISSWPYPTYANLSGVTFADGQFARVGDILICTNGFEPGGMYTVTKVDPVTGYVDVSSTNNWFQLHDDTGWLPMTPLLGGWVNYDTQRLPQYRRQNGRFAARGYIKSGTGTNIWAIPAGFRPTDTSTQNSFSLPGVANSAFCDFEIVAGATGYYLMWGGGSTVWVSLASLHWICDQ